ncbi:DNA repair protein RAD50 [Frankliniella fusca]|uniref:DNA repair protein RAD50 n=1 Tax=Frankliniella fusca TaxID=407009 RepID=A0AAE1H771_9NEOP|nr:DNA repair protein RAD50 [Frankliniella fusca]
MATLKKLCIGGVRSFGADDADHQFIEFDKPFTLILGRNGCGKTTIIEALKYACTGTFPVGQGSSFVRDPKLDRRVETRAQIKLQFLSCQGNDTVVSRLLQSTQKVKNISTTALDATISVTSKVGKKQLSGRCADIDELMVQHLGVSKPILNYVIFCHQEDSHWPLDEGKKVKERFDEIFDSTKYNKCIEEVRKLRKNTLADVKLETVKIKSLEQNVKTRRNKVEELKVLTDERDELKSKISKLKQECNETKKEYGSLSKRLEDYRAEERKRDSMKNVLESLENRRANHEEFISQLFTGTEEELEQVIRNFDDQLAAKKGRLDNMEREKRQVDKREQVTLQEKSILEKKIGELEAEKNHEQKTQEERNSRLSRLAVAFDLPTLTKEANDNEVYDLTQKVKEELISLAKSISTMKTSNDREQNDLQREIQKHRDARTKIEAELRMKTESIQQNEREIEEKEQLLKSVQSKLLQKEEIERELKRYKEQREKVIMEEDPQELISTIAKLKNETEKLEGDQNKLSAEVLEIAKHQELKNVLKKDEDKLGDLQSKIRRLRSKNEDFISCHLQDVDDCKLKYNYELLLVKLKKEIDTLNLQLLDKRRKESSLQKDLDFNEKTLKKKKEELDQFKGKIYAECKKEDLDAVLKSNKEAIDRYQNDKGIFTSSAVVIKRYIMDLKKREPCCPLCERQFDDEDEPLKLVDNLEIRVSTLPDQIEELNKTLSELQSRQEKLLQLKPLQNTITQLQTSEIPNLEASITKFDEELMAEIAVIASLEENLKEAKDNLTRAEIIRTDVFDIDRCQSECRLIMREIQKLKENPLVSSTSRNLNEAHDEQEEVRKNLISKREEKVKMEDRLRRHEKRLNEIEQKINSLTAEQFEIKEFIQQETTHRERVEDLKALNSALASEKEVLRVKLKPALEEQNRAEQKLLDVKNKHKRILEEKEREKGDRDKEMGIITQIQKSLDSLKSKRISEQLRENSLKIKSCSIKLEEIKRERHVLNQESLELSSDIDNHCRQRKELEENLKLMDVQKKIKMQVEKLKQKEMELGSWDFKTIEENCWEMQQRYQTLALKANNLEGVLKGKNENIASREKELNEDMYRNAEQKYKEKFVHLEVLKHVERDLQKYYNALDYALQNFHKDRMAAVNKSIREYWRLIYKGNDIDYIEIKTDESNPSTASSASDKKRIYNYRVVQVKSGTEIDMKGRCSAGQKVLACLIIRMALSEHFSMNCGILTLDEPTTNLDKSNIHSLCQAITGIVNDREGSKHFQLVVITHDSEFLNAMSAVDSFPHYWEVSRNNQ